ncbi:DSBA oxidoreductase [Xylariaceae sp. FL0662B]|nr:DSBA oxidoreductase [Xylariaceae sp. FL0662B]
MATINIKIISDTICPWCYVGKKRLDKAIELYKKVYPGGKDDTFSITWAPFYLDPTLPKVGVPVNEHYLQKFGPERVQAIKQRLATVGAEQGINFRFEGKMGNTRDSHRLIRLGKTKGEDVQNRVVAELFKEYFEGTGDITSHDTMIAAAGRAGLDKDEAKDWLETDKGGKEVDAEVEQAYAKNIHGVPHFTIQGQYEVDGAQDAQAFLDAFAKAKNGN